jgi:regulator of protease activity HflC (stomatin/prohibitin superfamily)
LNGNETKKTIFFAIVLLVAIAAVFIVLFKEEILANFFWIALLLVFIFLIMKYEILLMLKEYERAVIFRLGKAYRVGGPGWTLLIPFIETYEKVDLRVQTVDIPKQEVITKDNIELRVDAVVYLRVKKDKESVIRSVVEVKDYLRASKLFVISSIRNIVGSFKLSDVIANSDKLNQNLLTELQELASEWGIKVESANFKDINIPKTVIDAMHAEKAAVQRKLATIQNAEGSKAEITAVREAAETLSDRALAYYYLKALEKLGEGASTKFIFPVELTNLAHSIKNVMKKEENPQPELEALFRQYAPVIKKIAKPKKK